MTYPTNAHYDSMGLSWKPLDFEGSDIVTRRIEKACRKWEHTPYMAGQQTPGAGVDCVRFVCAVLDELYGVTNVIPREIQDRSLHDPEGAKRITRMVRNYYPDHTDLEVGDRCVEPGDVLVTGHALGGPGHAILVGGQPNTMWQAFRRAVRMGGLSLISHYQQICVIIRPNKSLWIPPDSL